MLGVSQEKRKSRNPLMEYGRSYSISELTRAAEFYLNLLDEIDLQFFIQDHLPYSRGEIVKAIQIGRQIKLQDKIPITSHPAIHSAIINQDFYKNKVEKINNSGIGFLSTQLYTEIAWLVGSIIGLIYNAYIKTVEIKIDKQEYIEAIKFMTIERQRDEYQYTHPSKFIERYREYLAKRINDFKELIEIDKLNFGVELKEIIRSYKLGLEINIKGRNLLTPLLEKNYELFVKNLRDTLLIPSYHDTYKKEKERFFHIYLLGILEGRLNFYKIQSNKESGFGRYDICGIPLLKSNPGFLIEVKSDDSLSEEAIEQIKSNEYLTELRNDGVKESMILAINFKEKEILTKYEIIKFEDE